MARLAKALVADGPALALTPSTQRSVAPKIALVVTTTGSQGVAKEVALTASSLLSSARASNAFLNAEFGSTWSLLLPLTHIAGINVLVRSLEVGTFPADLRNVDGPLPKVDFTSIVPTQLYKALHGDEHLLHHLQSARAVLVGGAALDSSLAHSAQEAGINVVTTYGSSETTGGCFYNGNPLLGVEFRIVEGRIEIKGATLAHSYLNSDLQLLNSEGWYETSDLGHIEADRLIIDGRSDDVIISGGVNISIRQVEEKLNSIAGLPCALVAIDDPKWGKSLVAFVEGLDQGINVTELNSQLGEGIFINAIHYIPALPLKGIGKIDTVALTELAKASQ
jgi:O-succinylbenzoic acid--CoA ligase